MSRLNIFQQSSPVKIYYKSWEQDNSPVSNGNTVSWATWNSLYHNYQSRDGLSVETSADVEAIEVMGYRTPVDEITMGEEITISVDLKKVDFDQLAVGMRTANYTSHANSNTISFNEGSTTEYSLGLEGFNPAGNKVVIYCPRVLPQDSWSGTFKRGDSPFTMGWKVLADSTEPTCNATMVIHEFNCS